MTDAQVRYGYGWYLYVQLIHGVGYEYEYEYRETLICSTALPYRVSLHHFATGKLGRKVKVVPVLKPILEPVRVREYGVTFPKQKPLSLATHHSHSPPYLYLYL